MTCQQRRHELRQIDKQIKSTWQHTRLADLMMEQCFRGLNKDDIDRLDNETYAGEDDEKKLTQRKYNIAREILSRLKQLEDRQKFLQKKGDLIKK